MQAQSANTIPATLAAFPAASQQTAPQPARRSASNAKYVLMQGQVLGRDRQPVDAFHLDVYELQPDGKRVLVRTSHYPTSHYKLYLESGASYELIVQANGYDTKQFYVEASEEGVAPTAVALKARPAAPLSRLPNLNYEVAAAKAPVKLPELRPLPDIPATAPTAQPIAVQPPMADPARRLGQIATGTPLLRGLRPGDEPLLQLPANAQVEVLERTTAHWWMVEYHGEIGWVRAAMIR